MSARDILSNELHRAIKINSTTHIHVNIEVNKNIFKKWNKCRDGYLLSVQYKECKQDRIGMAQSATLYHWYCLNSLRSSSDVISRDAQDDYWRLSISLQSKGKLCLKCIYWVLCTLIDKMLSNFLVKASHSPMTAMVLVFLVRTQCIDKDNCQKLVKLS